MSFSTEIAALVANQISRFVTLNRHQLAGQTANLDFWMAEVRRALQILDGYGMRFRQLKEAQARHVAKHHTVEFAIDDPCCTQGRPAAPRRIPDHELQTARRELSDATRRFLRRCYREALADLQRVRAAYEAAGIEFNTDEFKA